MMVATNILVALVALEHVWFAVLEMVLWRKPLGRATFRMTQEQADQTAVLAMNQGLYNLFLAAGLVRGLVAGGSAPEIFFLGCVVVAGIFGGITVNKRIAIVQAGPAALALALVLWER